MRLYKLTILTVIGLVIGVGAVRAQKTELRTVPRVDLKRYEGKWYEIAKYPNKFQKKCVANTTAEYTLKDNGRIEVKNRCVRKDGSIDTATGEAKIADKGTNAKLKVRFAPGFLSWLPFVWGDYWIIDLDPDYQHVAIGEPDRKYFWILARKPVIDDTTYRDILKRAEEMGFDPAKVEKSVQRSADPGV